VPFAVTVDRQSLDDLTVTLRERDSCAQVRLPSSELPGLLRQLVDEVLGWDQVMARYTVVTTGEDKAAAAGTVLGATPPATTAADPP
jgi:glycyl-tRNA synthetase